jgi:uncharacterized protein (DUF4213/DUF364 family)
MKQGTLIRPAILSETLDNLKQSLGNQMDKITLERVVFGLFFTGVKLSNGSGGLCFTPIKSMSQ